MWRYHVHSDRALMEPEDVLVEVDATVGKLAERSLLLELCTVFRQSKFLQM
jgi:hypothetical protein